MDCICDVQSQGAQRFRRRMHCKDRFESSDEVLKGVRGESFSLESVQPFLDDTYSTVSDENTIREADYPRIRERRFALKRWYLLLAPKTVNCL